MASETVNPWAGISYPFDGTIPGLLEYKGVNNVLKSAIENLLMTRLGERVMMPTFGTTVLDRLFDPNDDVLSSQLSSELSNAISVWDNRIEIVTLDTERDDHYLKIKLQYKCALDPLSEEIRSAEIQIPVGEGVSQT